MARSDLGSSKRSLDLLSRTVSLILRLGDAMGTNDGRVSVLRERLQRAQSELDAHRHSQPLDKRRIRCKSDEVLGLAIEYELALLNPRKDKR